jgi:hypothetical protein
MNAFVNNLFEWCEHSDGCQAVMGIASGCKPKWLLWSHVFGRAGNSSGSEVVGRIPVAKG